MCKNKFILSNGCHQMKSHLNHINVLLFGLKITLVVYENRKAGQ